MDDLIGAIPVLALMWVRACGVLAFIPLFGKRAQAWTLRFPIALAIALPTFSRFAEERMPSMSIADAIWMSARDFGIGLVCGAFFMPLFIIPRAAGTLVDQQAGTAQIRMSDSYAPDGEGTVFADLFEKCAVFSFVSAGGMSMLSEMFSISYATWPSTTLTFPDIRHFFEVVISNGYREIIVQIVLNAAPYVSVLFLFEYTIGLVGRAAPQINVLTTSAALKLWLSVLLIYLGGFHAFDRIPVAAQRMLHESELFLGMKIGEGKR
jgi:type III secretory pathway component EscT